MTAEELSSMGCIHRLTMMMSKWRWQCQQGAEGPIWMCLKWRGQQRALCFGVSLWPSATPLSLPASVSSCQPRARGLCACVRTKFARQLSLHPRASKMRFLFFFCSPPHFRQFRHLFCCSCPFSVSIGGCKNLLSPLIMRIPSCILHRPTPALTPPKS